MSPEDIKLAYKAVFSTNDGKIVMDDLCKRFHVAGPVFSPDPYETAFRDGQRTVVLFFNQMLMDKKVPEQTTTEEGD